MFEKNEFNLALEDCYKSPATFRFSQEGISAQKSILFEEITLAIQHFQTDSKKDKEALKDLASDIEKIMWHHTRLKIKLKVGGGTDAYVCVSALSAQNALTNQRFPYVDSKEIKTIKDAINVTKGLGTVDFKKSRVSGFFSEIETEMVIGIDFFRNERQTTAAETAAIILHELGHVFTIFSSIVYMATTNFALSGVADRLNKAKNTDEIAVVVKDFATDAKLSGPDTEALVGIARTAANKESIVVQLSLATRTMRPELGIGVPDQAQCEHMADEFAAMHGAGYELATGLDKWRNLLVIGRFITIGYDFVFIYSVIETIQLMLAGFFPVSAIITALCAAYLVAIDFSRDRNYGTFHDRIRKIRSSMIERMKDLDMNKAELALVVDKLDKLEKTIDEIPENRSMMTYVFEYLFKSAGDRRAMIKLQNNLEQIASNNLFVSAARLKTAI